jgi:hypothetical protein
MITEAVKKHQSYRSAVTFLQINEATAGAFQLLTESTVRSWYEPRTFVLKKSVEERVGSNCGGAGLAGRPSSMAAYPELERQVKEILSGIRKSSGAVNSSVIKVAVTTHRTCTAVFRCSSVSCASLAAVCFLQAVFQSVSLEQEPDLWADHKFTRRWCRQWLADNTDWTYKKATTSGQKLPSDWEAQITGMATRVTAAVATHQIKHGSFIINWSAVCAHSAVAAARSPAHGALVVVLLSGIRRQSSSNTLRSTPTTARRRSRCPSLA